MPPGQLSRPCPCLCPSCACPRPRRGRPFPRRRHPPRGSCPSCPSWFLGLLGFLRLLRLPAALVFDRGVGRYDLRRRLGRWGRRRRRRVPRRRLRLRRRRRLGEGRRLARSRLRGSHGRRADDDAFDDHARLRGRRFPRHGRALERRRHANDRLLLRPRDQRGAPAESIPGARQPGRGRSGARLAPSRAEGPSKHE